MQVPILHVIMYDTTLLSALFDYVCVTLTTSKKCRLYQRLILTHSQMLFSVSAFYCILLAQRSGVRLPRIIPTYVSSRLIFLVP